MQYRVLFAVMAVGGLLLYFYQFHFDAIHQYAISPPSTTARSPAVESLLDSGAPVESRGQPGAPSSSSSSSSESPPGAQTYLHTDQVAYNKRRAQQCNAVMNEPVSQYGSQISSIAVSYFNKYVDNFKFTFCTVPKVGSTNWKRTLIVLGMPEEERKRQTKETVNALRNVHNSKEIHDLTRVHGSPSRRPYSSYYNAVFFRHPFTRVVSAWRNKFQLVDGKINKSFYKKYGIAMIELARGKAGLQAYEANEKENLVTFPEFVQGVMAGLVDRHWMPQTEICYPCEVRYDFVGFFEYMDSDTNYVLSQIGVTSDSLHADKLSNAGRTYSTVDLTRELFKTLPSEGLDFLTEFYRKDFLLFGYSPNVTSEHFPYPAIEQCPS